LLPALLLLAAVYSLRRAQRRWLLPALLLLAGWLNYSLHTAVLSSHDLRQIIGVQPWLGTVRGVLEGSPTFRLTQDKHPWHSLAILKVTGIASNSPAWKPACGRVAVSTPEQMTNWFAGQTVEITGVLARPPGPQAPGLFDYQAYLEEQGIYYHLQTVSEKDWRILSSPPRRPLADRFRAWGMRTLALGLPAEDESLRLEWALTLGWKTALTEEVAEPFVRAATYHIFAVDGLRMAIIFGIVFGLCRALRLSRPWIALLSWPLLWFYVVLTGCPASAIRACIMVTIVSAGWMLKRPGNPLNSLFLAALIILACQPQQLFQAGFQLSFFVVLALILLIPPLQAVEERLRARDPLLPRKLPPQNPQNWRDQFRKPLTWFGGLLVTSFAAWIGSLPLVAQYFNLITPVSTPANIPAVPLCGLVLICNLCSLLLGAWLPSGAELFNHAGWFLMECIRVSSEWFARWPAAYCYIPAPSLLTTVLYYALLVAIVTGWLFQPAWRRVKLGALALAAVVWLAQEWREHTLNRLTLLPQGGSLTIFYDAPGWRHDLLIDCGSTNTVSRITRPFLRAQGVNQLQRLALTHGDSHHAGGVEVLDQLFSPGQVFLSPVRPRSRPYRRFEQSLNARTNRLQRVARGHQIRPWTVLHPPAGTNFPRADDNALVLRMPFAETTLLLLSDLGRPGQNLLLEQETNLRADIVIAGLPANGEPLCDALVDAIHPKLIIVADAESPATEQAPARLRARLQARNTPILYTRETGALTLEWKGADWRLKTQTGLTFCPNHLPAIGTKPPQPNGTVAEQAEED
jgi:competence protein ComEC